MTNKIGRLIKVVKKDLQWVVFELPDGEKIKVLTRDDKFKNSRKTKLIIDCPKSIKIDYEENDNIGNQ